MKKLFSYEVREKATLFTSCQNLGDLEQLGFDINAIQLLSMHPPYYTFQVRKSSGGFRNIEAPEDHLKSLQKQFNFYLQCVYHTHQTAASYGYIIRVRDAKEYKNILENAKQHLHAKYMLNVDFEDFFHQISSQEVSQILQTIPFQFDKKTAHLLSRLFTRHGRLPMGAPTSPVFSNLATIPLDNALTKWATEREIRFTRFVDDLTFSSKTKSINLPELEQIKAICKEHELQLNPNKTKVYGEGATMKVTGLVLNETIDIDPTFYTALEKDLVRLKHLAEVSLRMNKHNQDASVRSFKQEMQGQINFIGMIEGYGSTLFYDYRQKLKAALNPDEAEAFSASWINASYF